jgi:hypothetical protein
MTTNEVLTLSLSGLSLAVSIAVAVYSWKKDRVQLRLIPGFVVKPLKGNAAVCQGPLPPVESGCELQGYILDVINVGSRAATVYEVGFRVKSSGPDRFHGRVTRMRRARVPFVDAKTTLGCEGPPVRLESADRVSFSLPIGKIVGGAPNIIDAYVSTGCGKFFYGYNRGLRDFCQKWVESNNGYKRIRKL